MKEDVFLKEIRPYLWIFFIGFIINVAAKNKKRAKVPKRVEEKYGRCVHLNLFFDFGACE